MSFTSQPLTISIKLLTSLPIHTVLHLVYPFNDTINRSYDLSNAQQYVNEFTKIFRHMTAFDPDGRPVFQQTKMRFYKGSLGRMLSKLSAVYMGFGPLPSM